MNIKKVVLAYSGGLDTSIIVKWLIETYGCEVVCVAGDVGQEEELDGLEDKAKKTGASKCYVEDLRQRFIEDFIWPTLKAGAIYEGRYLLGTSFARPLIAKRQVEIALAEGADAVAHGCTGKGNDQVRFELTYKAFNPKLHIIAPWREWNIRSREDAIAYAEERKIPIKASKEKIYSNDRNIWHISHEGGDLEDPWNEPKEEMYVLSVSPEKAPDRPTYVEVNFEAGIPVGLNGKRMGAVPLVQELNKLAGANGIGRADIVENRLVGMKSRGVYETPAGTVLYFAHNELESLVLDRETLYQKTMVLPRYAQLVYNGAWYTPVREALDAFVNVTQKLVTGTVRLKLYKGNIISAGRKSPYSLYREDFATFSEEDVYDQKDAKGFINLFGLPLTVRALVQQEWDKQASHEQPGLKYKRD